MNKALNAPDIRPKLEDASLTVMGGSADEFAALVKSSFERYGRIVKAAGVKPE